MKKILFICTGNTCRSPMASAILQERYNKNIEVRSAGIMAFEGCSISENSSSVLRKNNIFFNHKVKRVDLGCMEWASLILTMTENHKIYLKEMYPLLGDKIYFLSEYVNESNWKDIHDPFGGTLEEYKQTFEELDKLINLLIKKIS